MSEVRNTAVPGTTVGRFLARFSTRNSSGTSSRRVFSVSRFRPWIQMVMIAATTKPTSTVTAAIFYLEEAGHEEADVDDEEWRHHEDGRAERELPQPPHH